jgi:hypothetical protein
VQVTAHDASSNTGADASDADFSITDTTPPTVTITAPVGGGSVRPARRRT